MAVHATLMKAFGCPTSSVMGWVVFVFSSSCSQPSCFCQALEQGCHRSAALRTKLPLSTWLNNSLGVNQKEVVVIIRFILEHCKLNLTPTAATPCHLPLQLLRLLQKLNKVEVFKDEMAHIFNHVDGCLTRCFLTMKNDGVTHQDWWASFKEVASFVMPPKEVEILLQGDKGQWMAMEGEIQNMMVSSKLAEKFLFAINISLQEHHWQEVPGDNNMET